MKKLFFLFITISIIRFSLFSQNYMDVLKAGYFYMPENTFTNSDEKLSLSGFRADLAVPFKLNEEDLIGFKPQYKNFTICSESSPLNKLQLYSLKLPVFYLRKFNNPKWTSYIELSPKLHSNLNDVSINHFQIGGMALFYYEKKPGFFWQLGVYYNQETYGPFIVPLLGFDYKISDKSYIVILIPAFMAFEYKILPFLNSGFEVELFGDTYRLGESDFKNSFINQTGKNKLNFLTETRLFFDFYMAKHYVLYVKPGLRLFQKYEQYTEDDKRIVNSDYLQGELKNSFYMEIGLAYRFRYDEENGNQ